MFEYLGIVLIIYTVGGCINFTQDSINKIADACEKPKPKPKPFVNPKPLPKEYFTKSLIFD